MARPGRLDVARAIHRSAGRRRACRSRIPRRRIARRKRLRESVIDGELAPLFAPNRHTFIS
jgi:hypothetical protein